MSENTQDSQTETDEQPEQDSRTKAQLEALVEILRRFDEADLPPIENGEFRSRRERFTYGNDEEVDIGVGDVIVRKSSGNRDDQYRYVLQGYEMTGLVTFDLAGTWYSFYPYEHVQQDAAEHDIDFTVVHDPWDQRPEE